MIKWLWILLAVPAMAQTAAVSGKIQTYSPGIAPNALGNYVEFALTNCGNNTPQVNGTAVLLTKPIDFFPDSTGALTAGANGGIAPSLYGNDVINCGGAFTSRYSVRYYVGGIAQGPAKFYYISSTAPFDLTTATPINLQPPLSPPYPNLTTCPVGSYTNGLNKDLSVKCANLPAGASNAVVVNPSATQEINGQPLILDGPLFSQSLNHVLYSQPGDTISSIQTACSLFCTYMVTTPQTITLTGNTSLSSKVNLQFANSGMWTVNGSGSTLTITGQVSGTLAQHFAGTGSVKFGTLQSQVPVEWFGAAADWNGTTGTDNTIAIQNSLNALTTGQILLQQGKYAVSNTLTITSSNVGIQGTVAGGAIGSAVQTLSPSVIMNTTSTTTTLVVGGTGPTTMTLYNKFDHFALERSVAPSAFTVEGMYLNYAAGAMIDFVQSMDSGRDFHFHNVPAFGIGVISHTWASWGYNGFTEGASVQLTGYFLDSQDGNPEASITIDESAATSPLPNSVTTNGMFIQGSAINDVEVTGFGTGNVSYGLWIQYSGGGGGIGSQDLHFVNSINDGCKITCITVLNTSSSSRGTVDFDGGWANSQAISAAPTINLELATGTTVRGMQISNSGSATAGILMDRASNNIIANNIFISSSPIDIFMEQSFYNVISGNSMTNTTTTAAMSVVNLSSHNTMLGNVMGNSGTPIPIGISFDTGSTFNIASTYDNVINATTQIVDPSGLNEAYIPALGLVREISGAGTPTLQVQAAAGTGATASLVTGSNDLTGGIILTTGTSPTAAASLLHLTFGTAKRTSPIFIITPAGANAGALGAWTNALSNGVVSLYSGTATPAASTTYQWDYVVTGLFQ